MADMGCRRTGSRSPGRAMLPGAPANTQGPGLLRPARRRDARRRHHARTPPSTTGTCRRRCEDAGGWAARDTADQFADYAPLVAERLGDRVDPWATSTNRGARRSSATSWASTPRTAATAEAAHRRAPPAPGPRPGHHRAVRAVAPGGAVSPLVLNLGAVRAVTVRPRPRPGRGAADRRAAQPGLFLDPDPAGTYPTDVLAEAPPGAPCWRA